MNTAAPIEAEKVEVKNENVVHLPLGLLGFEEHKKYVLLTQEGESPFVWMQMLESPHQSFLMVPPAVILPDYRPELSREDVAFLGLEGPDDALVYNIVTLRRGGESTVNLKGPVVINRRTLVGKQVIPRNVAGYALHHPLPAA